MHVCALQMVSGPSVEHNLQAAEPWLARAAEQGAELVALPEYFCLIGQRDQDKLAIAEAEGEGPIQDWLARMAQRHQIWIVGGTIPVLADRAERVFNRTLVFAPDGRCVARYDKIHLFRFDNGRERYDESQVLQAGQQPALFELPSRDGHRWRVGLSVCYDLRFPELYRGLSAQGAELLLVPSAFTHTTGQAHWELLLRARAVENLAYVLAPAQGGVHPNGRQTWGHSMLIDPWGQVLAEHVDGPGLAGRKLQLTTLQQCRQQLPALNHRVL